MSNAGNDTNGLSVQIEKLSKRSRVVCLPVSVQLESRVTGGYNLYMLDGGLRNTYHSHPLWASEKRGVYAQDRDVYHIRESPEINAGRCVTADDSRVSVEVKDALHAAKSPGAAHFTLLDLTSQADSTDGPSVYTLYCECDDDGIEQLSRRRAAKALRDTTSQDSVSAAKQSLGQATSPDHRVDWGYYMTF